MTAGSGGPAFFDKTYDEALALTEETYAYLAEIDASNVSAHSPLDDLCLRCEAFRLTTRLMQVVAWLLSQRAVHEGELSAAEFAHSEKYRLGATRVCRDGSQHGHPAIPAEMTDILDRSLNLYVRIERLDEMMNGRLH